MSPAERQARHRRRQQRGLASSWMDYDDTLFEALIYKKLLDRRDASDPAKLRAALSAMGKDWARLVYPFA